MIKLCLFRLRKCYFGVLAVKYKQEAFQKMLTQFWTASSVKYKNVTINFKFIGGIKCNMSNLQLWKGKTKVGEKGVCSRYLF